MLREESRYYPKLEKVTLHKSGLILLGIGIVFFLMGLSIHDKQLTIENGNAIVGALFRHYWHYIGLPRILLEVQHHECIEVNYYSLNKTINANHRMEVIIG